MGIHVEDPGRRDVTFDEMVANYKIADPGPGGRGSRPPASRDLVRHPGPEGVPVRHRRVLRGDRQAVAGDDLGDDLREPPDALGPAGRGLLLLGLPFRRPERGAELRGGGRADARRDREPGGDLPHPDQLLPQRRHARRVWRVPGRSRPHGRGPGRVRPRGLAQPRGRLLRHHSGVDRGHRRGRRGRAAPEGAGPASLVDLQRHGAAGRSPRDQFRDDRRADQHHRLQEVRPADQERRLRIGADRGPGAGGERGQPHRRQHGRGADRRREGHDPVPQPGLGRSRNRQGSDHDRQLQVERHRGGAEVRAGQVDRQLDQPQGGRGEVPRTGEAGSPLRGGGGRDGL